ncbi:MAG: gfo/Idh/MocA family oxidoreductase [Proteobacteria bacterium]|nr:gfo/Idh/MocA family oxidoreductase [Pseudomonadota bacterium]
MHSSSSSTPFRFILIGSGNISRTYLRAIAQLPGVQAVGVVSRSGRRPEGLPAEAGVFPTLADVNVPFDAVILTTPNGLHHQGAIEAAALGKHVLTEKVLEISLDAMDRMTRACHDAGVKLAVTYQRRMSPDNRAVKKLLESGQLGRVFAADMQVKFWRDEAYYKSGAYRGTRAVDGGGAFTQQASHNADLLCWFFGMPKRVVSLCDTFRHDIEVEDHGVALLHYPDGMIGTFTASTACQPGFPTRLEVHATAGSFVMENDCITQWHIAGLPNPAEKKFQVHDGASSAAVTDTAGHEAIIRDFVDAIREGREPAVPAESGRLATELILKIYGNNLLATPAQG